MASTVRAAPGAVVAAALEARRGEQGGAECGSEASREQLDPGPVVEAEALVGIRQRDQARGHAEPELDPPRYRELLHEYVARMQAGGAPERAALGRLKQWLRLGAPAFAEVDALFQAIKGCAELEPALAILSSPDPRAPGRPPRRASPAPAVATAPASAP